MAFITPSYSAADIFLSKKICLLPQTVHFPSLIIPLHTEHPLVTGCIPCRHRAQTCRSPLFTGTPHTTHQDGRTRSRQAVPGLFDHERYLVGSATPASMNPFRLIWQLSQVPQDVPSSPGSSAAVSKAVINSETMARHYYLGLCKAYKGRFNDKGLSLNSRLCPGGGHGAEGLEKLRAAVRIAAVVNGIGPDKDMGGADRLRVAQGVGQKNNVSCRNVGIRYPLGSRVLVLGHIDSRRLHQGGAEYG